VLLLQVKHVINYDFPLYMADYIHRCGRTGRVGSDEGSHVSNFIVNSREVELVQKIEVCGFVLTVAFCFVQLHYILF
jgi:superfamily II DNA/RNA helicase